MSIEPRHPPSQFVAKLRHALGGRAGWNGVAVQILFVAALVWIGGEIIANARANLEAQRITSGFGFLKNTAGFDVSQNLIPYSGSDTYTRVFFVGLLNTLLVSVIGIFFATVIGFLVALGRLSPNWLLSRIAGGYVEAIRNVPLLFQILFWYLAVLGALPNPRQSIALFDSFFLSNRGLVIPRPVGNAGFEPFVVVLLIAVVAAVGLWRYARRKLFDSGRVIRIWPYTLGLLIGLPLVSALILSRFQYHWFGDIELGLVVALTLPVIAGIAHTKRNPICLGLTTATATGSSGSGTRTCSEHHTEQRRSHGQSHDSTLSEHSFVPFC